MKLSVLLNKLKHLYLPLDGSPSYNLLDFKFAIGSIRAEHVDD